MRKLLVLGVLALAFLGYRSARAEDMSGNVQFFVGQRWLGDDWKPVNQPAIFGVEVDFAPTSSPIRVALATMIASDSGTAVAPVLGHVGDVNVAFFEMSAGFLWVPVKKGVARPYLGGGVVLMGAGFGKDWNFWDSGSHDHSFGFYENAGVYFKVGDTFNIGMDGRFVQGTKFTFAGQDVNANYEQASLLLGFSWGK
ncbi:MAG TPA: hypothetical protein VFV19_00290 [Candidatus Polarisedimenticolaceae bacterium]|nr:hypothetical protein [Candidatus Polarisedimenticolaceae bacterium]